MRVNLSNIDRYFEQVVMTFVLGAGDAGVRRKLIDDYLWPHGDAARSERAKECPELALLSYTKQKNRLNRNIVRLSAESRLKITKSSAFHHDVLMPLNVLEKIVGALIASDKADESEARKASVS